MVIVKTIKDESFVWKKELSVEEAQKEMLNLYNFLFQGERNNAPNWGVALRRSMNEVNGASGRGDARCVTIGNVLFEMWDEATADQIIREQKPMYYL